MLGLASAGYADKWISAQLGISANTLRTYWSRIRGKVGELPRTALVAAYVERELSSHPQEPGGVIDLDWDWYINFDRWTFRLLNAERSPLPSSLAEEVSLEVALEYFYDEDRLRVRSLVEASLKGQLTLFHFVARLQVGKENRLATAFCQVERDSHGRPTGLYGRRMPSLDLRVEPLLQSTVGSWGYRLPEREFWADRSARAIFGISTTDPDPESTFLNRFHPQDVAAVRRSIDRVMNESIILQNQSARLVFDGDETRWIILNLEMETGRDQSVQLVGTVIGFL